MKWTTQKRKLSELKNWESNPRTISDEKFDELVSSIDDLGNFEPLVVDTDGTVIAGNQRLKVAQKLGETEVEVSVPERKLTEEEIKKIGIISNKHSGEWDMDKLANEFEDVLNELGFDDLLPNLYGDKNEEIDVGDFEDIGIIKFRFSQQEYIRVLSLIANAVEKTESETNEECLLKLLKEYE